MSRIDPEERDTIYDRIDQLELAVGKLVVLAESQQRALHEIIRSIYPTFTNSQADITLKDYMKKHGYEDYK